MPRVHPCDGSKAISLVRTRGTLNLRPTFLIHSTALPLMIILVGMTTLMAIQTGRAPALDTTTLMAIQSEVTVTQVIRILGRVSPQRHRSSALMMFCSMGESWSTIGIGISPPRGARAKGEVTAQVGGIKCIEHWENYKDRNLTPRFISHIHHFESAYNKALSHNSNSKGVVKGVVIQTSIWTSLRKLESASFLHSLQVYILGKLGEAPFWPTISHRRIYVAFCSIIFMRSLRKRRLT